MSRASSVDGQVPLRSCATQRRGRFEARRAGLAAAPGTTSLLLDARVQLDPERSAFVHGRLADGEPVWNGHVHVESGSALGDVLGLLAELAWRDYFDNPRTTSFGDEEFDRFPKGTTCFLAPREVLLSGVRRVPLALPERAARERRHADPASGRRARAHPHLAAIRMQLRAAHELGRFLAPCDSPRRRSSSTDTARRSRASSRTSWPFSR